MGGLYMGDLYTVNVSGCKRCGSREPEFGRGRLPQHDHSNPAYEHDYLQPTPLEDVLLAAFSDQPWGKPPFRHPANITFSERRTGTGNRWRSQFAGVLVQFQDEEWHHITRQVPLRKDNTIDLEKLRAVVSEAEAEMVRIQQRKGDNRLKAQQAEALVKRVGAAAGLTQYDPAMLVNCESDSVKYLQINLRWLKEDEAVALLKFVLSLKAQREVPV